jgi:hypothetical protein
VILTTGSLEKEVGRWKGGLGGERDRLARPGRRGRQGKGGGNVEDLLPRSPRRQAGEVFFVLILGQADLDLSILLPAPP